MPHSYHHCFPQVHVPPQCTVTPALDGSVYLPPFYQRAPIAASLLVQPGTYSVVQRPCCAPQVTCNPAMVTPVLPQCCLQPFGNVAPLLAPGQCGVGSACGLGAVGAGFAAAGYAANAPLLSQGYGGAFAAPGLVANGLGGVGVAGGLGGVGLASVGGCCGGAATPLQTPLGCGQALPPLPIGWVQNATCAQF